MRIEEWHEAGLEPAFGSVEGWIADQLGRLGAEELAVYAVKERGGARILVATDLGLFDYRWRTSADPAKRAVEGRLHAWWEVEGLVLEAETRLDPNTLSGREPAWSLRLTRPELAVDASPSEEALLGFWRACHDRLRRVHAASGGPGG